MKVRIIHMFVSLNGIETAQFYEFREWTNLNFPSHYHYTFEVIFVVFGEIVVEKENKAYRLKKGDAIAVMPFERHGCVTENESQIFVVQISPSLISNWDVCFSGKTFKNPCCKFSDAEIAEIYDNFKASNKNIIKLNYAFFKIMNTLENEFIESYNVDGICIEVLRYVGENFKRNITLKDMARELNVSYVYLSRVFAQKIKFKFVDCINSFRIQEAMSLLSSPNKSISEICYECGFGSLRQFNRLFLNMMSCTPSEYRKRNNK